MKRETTMKAKALTNEIAVLAVADLPDESGAARMECRIHIWSFANGAVYMTRRGNEYRGDDLYQYRGYVLIRRPAVMKGDYSAISNGLYRQAGDALKGAGLTRLGEGGAWFWQNGNGRDGG